MESSHQVVHVVVCHGLVHSMHMYQVAGQEMKQTCSFSGGACWRSGPEGHVDMHLVFGHDQCCRWQAVLVIAKVMHSLEGDQLGEVGLQVGIKILNLPVLQEPALHIG